MPLEQLEKEKKEINKNLAGAGRGHFLELPTVGVRQPGGKGTVGEESLVGGSKCLFLDSLTLRGWKNSHQAGGRWIWSPAHYKWAALVVRVGPGTQGK